MKLTFTVLIGLSALVGLQLVRCQVHFDCPQLPPLTRPAKTVHELRPQDIKVVMALGDSVTAGTSRYLSVSEARRILR